MTVRCDAEGEQHSGSVTLQAGKVSGDMAFLTAMCDVELQRFVHVSE